MGSGEIKIISIKKHDTDDLVPRLERILELARENRLCDFAAVYYLNDEPSFTLSYRARSRIRLIGHLEVLKKALLDLIDIQR